MKNIIQIFKNDLLRIHKNVIAMIVIMGITVIPTLYAWFNRCELGSLWKYRQSEGCRGQQR